MATNRVSPKKGKVVDIPTVPTVGTATAGAESATVAYTASTKGGPVTTFTALSNPGSITGSGSSSPITVSGLTGGTAYTFTVRGNNATGSSEYSSASGSVTPTVSTSYESIASAYGTGSANTITFSSIPATYKHLQLRLLLRQNTARSDLDYAGLKINGDSTSGNYRSHYVNGSNGSATVGDFGNSTSGMFTYMMANGNTGTASYAVAVIDILDYTDTNKYKTVRSLAGYQYNDTYDTVGLFSGLWMSTSAITSLSVKTDYGSLTTASHAALYGIKG